MRYVRGGGGGAHISHRANFQAFIQLPYFFFNIKRVVMSLILMNSTVVLSTCSYLSSINRGTV